MRTRKRFGQHFLESAWADKVVAAIAPQPADRFVEIGPGPGVLTFRLAPRVAHLTAIEVDRDIAAELRPRLPGNVDLVVADVLEVDLLAQAEAPFRIAGNLPYNISTPILFRLIACSRSVQAWLPPSGGRSSPAVAFRLKPEATRSKGGRRFSTPRSWSSGKSPTGSKLRRGAATTASCRSPYNCMPTFTAC